MDELLRLLIARETRPDARQALRSLRNRILPKLQTILNERTQPADLRYRLPRGFRAIGSTKVLEVILFSNTQPDAASEAPLVTQEPGHRPPAAELARGLMQVFGRLRGASPRPAAILSAPVAGVTG